MLIAAHPTPTGISRGHAEVAGPVIAALHWRGPWRCRGLLGARVSYRDAWSGARRRARIHWIADVHDRVARRRIPRAPAGGPSGRVSEPAQVLGRRIHLWAWAGRRGRATQRRGMYRARVSPARRRAHRAPSGRRRTSGGLPVRGGGGRRRRGACRSSSSASSGSFYSAGCSRPARRAFSARAARVSTWCHFRVKAAASVRAAAGGG
jgi:hypothetical protein